MDTTDTNAVKAAIHPNTKLIHVETPGTPTTGISDLDTIAEVAHKVVALLSVDATFAGPSCIYPLQHGAGLKIHSMIKYINDPGDSLGSCVMGNTELVDQIKKLAMVGILSLFNAWLVTRGLWYHADGAAQQGGTGCGGVFGKGPAVQFVWYPGLESHPQH